MQFSKDVPNTGIVVGSIVGIMLFAALLGFLLLRHRHVSEGTPKAHPSSNSSTKHSSSAAVVSTNPGVLLMVKKPFEFYAVLEARLYAPAIAAI